MMSRNLIRRIIGEIFRIVVIVSLFLFLLISSYFIYATITTTITTNQGSHDTSTHFYIKKGGSNVHVDIVIPYVLYEETIDTIEVIKEDGVRWYSLDTTAIEVDTIYHMVGEVKYFILVFLLGMIYHLK